MSSKLILASKHTTGGGGEGEGGGGGGGEGGGGEGGGGGRGRRGRGSKGKEGRGRGGRGGEEGEGWEEEIALKINRNGTYVCTSCIWCLSEWVDLYLSCVHTQKHLVQVLYLIGSLSTNHESQ